MLLPWAPGRRRDDDVDGMNAAGDEILEMAIDRDLERPSLD